MEVIVTESTWLYKNDKTMLKDPYWTTKEEQTWANKSMLEEFQVIG